MTSSAPVATVIAGLGRAGWDIHWKQMLKGHPRFRVVAAIEPVAARRAEAEAEIGCRTYASFADFLEDPIGELIVLATPSGGHGQEAIDCLERGLHVAVDKPMCQGTAEADRMIATAQHAKRLLTCYHPYRYSDDMVAIRQILKSGRLGRIVQVSCNRTSFTRRNDWVMRKAKGGGLHNVHASHLVDECLHLIDSPVRDVFADLQRTVTPGDADDHCQILLRCANGAVIDVMSSNCMAFPPQPPWMIAGTCGGLILTPEGIKLKWFDPKAAPAIAIQDGPAVNRSYKNDDVLPWQDELVPVVKARGFAGFFDNLVAAVRDGVALDITPESVRQTIAVLETCRTQNPRIWAGF
ncbi:MAG: Gfo/Idh/MocA family oxidoreductase [Planctomycetota bacterium]